MNNEEKKPVVNEESLGSATPASSSNQNSGGWWQKLSTGAKAGIIAGISCLVVAITVLVIVLLGGNGSGNGGPGSNNNGNNGNGGSGKTATYSVTVVTKGGMALENLPVYIHEYEDGVLGEMVDGGYGATDASGKVTFNLPEGKEYAANLSIGIPNGYDVATAYPLLSGNTPITVSSSVIPETSLVGVSYNVGSVMRDFSVVTTDGKTFTLSEVLKEKDAVLINFWYTTCSWCVTEFPLMQAAYEEYKEDLAIIALDPYADDTPEAIRSFKESYGLTFDVAKDLSTLTTAFNVSGYPTSVMIDRYGVVTLIEVGAITVDRDFECLFDYYTGDDYEQKLINSVKEIVPKIKPNVQMPSSDEISQAFDKGTIDGIKYSNDETDEYSWPFIIGEIGEGDDKITCLTTTNTGYENSYSQLLINMELQAGDVLAFDYFASTELGSDILYVIVNGKDIYSISGESEDWETCYAYVAEETGEYEIGLIYMKDSSKNVGNDTVYIKDLRIVTENDIDRETYIYRFAAKNPDRYNEYQDYVEIFLGTDGYYHVGSETGPILLADLMGFTRFIEDDYVYNMSLGKDYEIKMTEYCNYASNSAIYGHCSVNEELKALLWRIVEDYGNPDNENDWLKMCCYYDSYGTDKELEDPIKGLALFSAYDVILSEKGDTDFPNSFTYDRVIMPRGLLGKFTPTVSGTYLITSNAYDEETNTHAECNAWIFTKNGFEQRETWLTYDNISRLNISDNNNCYMIAYLEAGKDYYIDIAYYDVYGEGTIKYRVERLGGEGYYRFSLASPGFFTALESVTGELTETIAGGIDVELGDDGIWREKRPDSIPGSILYADFTMTTPIFTNKSIAKMIELGAFDFSRTEDDQYIINYLMEFDYDAEACDEYLREMWGEDYETYAEIYMLEDVYAGIYHGEGEDYTELARSFYNNRIVEGYNEQLNETISADDERIGCVVVTKELADLLQILMDKYTFDGVENSWRKLCYYHQYFCAATPK